MSVVAMFTSELEAGICRERASTVGSVSLEEQYEHLGAATDCCHTVAGEQCGRFEQPLDNFSATMSRVFVDLIEDDRNPTCITETCDLSTECSDSPDVEDIATLATLDMSSVCELGTVVSVHVDIDEEDDDIYFSMHKQEPQMQQDAASACEQSPHLDMDKPEPQAPQDVASTCQSTYVDIDEDDDDICFSIHSRGPQEQEDVNIHQQEPLPQLGPLPCSTAEVEVAGNVAESVTNVTLPCDNSVQRLRSARSNNDCTPPCNSSAPVVLRHVGCESSEQLAGAIGGIAPGLLANLTGGRAQGVRKHLERKLSKGRDED